MNKIYCKKDKNTVYEFYLTDIDNLLYVPYGEILIKNKDHPIFALLKTEDTNHLYFYESIILLRFGVFSISQTTLGNIYGNIILRYKLNDPLTRRTVLNIEFYKYNYKNGWCEFFCSEEDMMTNVNLRKYLLKPLFEDESGEADISTETNIIYFIIFIVLLVFTVGFFINK